MGSAVTALNRYTKTIVEFKYKRRNIEKSLHIKQKLLDLELPDNMWDVYLTPGPPGQPGAEAAPPVNGHKPASGKGVAADGAAMADRQGEEYC